VSVHTPDSGGEGVSVHTPDSAGKGVSPGILSEDGGLNRFQLVKLQLYILQPRKQGLYIDQFEFNVYVGMSRKSVKRQDRLVEPTLHLHFLVLISWFLHTRTAVIKWTFTLLTEGALYKLPTFMG
jgi:hypothetical protein